MKKHSFTISALSILLIAQNSFSEGHNKPTGNKGTALFKIAGREVIVVKGARPIVSSHGKVVLMDRSLPQEDPSEKPGYYFELKNFEEQADLISGELADDAGSSLKQKSKWVTQPQIQMISTIAMWGAKSPAESYQDAIENNDKSRLSLLGLHRDRYRPFAQKVEDGLSLINSDYEFYGMSDRKFGYCWGFSTVARRLTMLAFFDPTLKAPVPAYVKNGLTKNEQWFRYYEAILDKLLLSKKPQVIPGFANIRDLTMVPEIEFYLKVRAMDLWADVAANSSSIPIFYSGDKVMEQSQIISLAKDLKTRTQRGELVKILFAAKNSVHLLDIDWLNIHKGATDVHSVLVTGVDLNPDFTGKIHLWDINFYAEDYVRNDHTIDIFKDASGKLSLKFDTWRETLDTVEASNDSAILGQVQIVPEYDAETGIMMNKLESFCRSPKTAKYCLNPN